LKQLLSQVAAQRAFEGKLSRRRKIKISYSKNCIFNPFQKKKKKRFPEADQFSSVQSLSHV